MCSFRHPENRLYSVSNTPEKTKSLACAFKFFLFDYHSPQVRFPRPSHSQPGISCSAGVTAHTPSAGPSDAHFPRPHFRTSPATSSGAKLYTCSRYSTHSADREHTPLTCVVPHRDTPAPPSPQTHPPRSRRWQIEFEVSFRGQGHSKRLPRAFEVCGFCSKGRQPSAFIFQSIPMRASPCSHKAVRFVSNIFSAYDCQSRREIQRCKFVGIRWAGFVSPGKVSPIHAQFPPPGRTLRRRNPRRVMR